MRDIFIFGLSIELKKANNCLNVIVLAKKHSIIIIFQWLDDATNFSINKSSSKYYDSCSKNQLKIEYLKRLMEVKIVCPQTHEIIMRDSNNMVKTGSSGKKSIFTPK
jgi:hypothetical protein